MWSGKRPFIAIGPPQQDDPWWREPEGIEIKNLKDLDNLKATIRNRSYLTLLIKSNETK